MRFLIGLIILIHGYGCSVAFAASVSATFTVNTSPTDAKPKVVRWSNLTSGDTSVYVQTDDAKFMSMQTSGTFAGSGTLILDGSNDCVTFHALRDQMVGVVSSTAASLVNVTTRAKCVRPRMSGGSTGTDVHLYLSY